VITVNKQFPGPVVNVTTNYNVAVNVLNSLDEPLLITWYATILSNLQFLIALLYTTMTYGYSGFSVMTSKCWSEFP
jgi:hypothetical protein